MTLSSASIVLVIVSSATLALGFQIWRLTSSKIDHSEHRRRDRGLIVCRIQVFHAWKRRNCLCNPFPRCHALCRAGDQHSLAQPQGCRSTPAIDTHVGRRRRFALCDSYGLLCVATLLTFTDPPNGEVLQFSGIPKTHFILNPRSIGVYRRCAQLKCFGNLTSRLATSNQIQNFDFAIS